MISRHLTSIKQLTILLVSGILYLAQETHQSDLSNIRCPQFFQQEYEEEPILEMFKKALESGKVETINPECGEQLMKLGFFESLEYLIDNWYVPKSIDIFDDIRTTAAHITRTIESSQTLATNFKEQIVITPAFKWGQNQTHVLLFVKFTHRFDTPGCLDLWNHNLNVNATHFSFQAQGISMDSPILFKLEFPFFENAVLNDANYKTESVGTLVIHIRKEKKQIWRRLTSQDFDEKRLSMQVWWELQGVYKSAMNKYRNLLNQEEDLKVKKLWDKSDTPKEFSREEKLKNRESWTQWIQTFMQRIKAYWMPKRK